HPPLRAEAYALFLRTLTHENRRRVAGPIIQAFPGDLAAVRIEGDDRGSLAAHVDQNLTRVDQRGARHAKEEVLARELLQCVHLPDLLPLRGIERSEQPGDAERVNASAGDGRRGSGPVAIQALEG